MDSGRRCGGGSIGDDTAEVPLPGVPENSAWAAQPLRRLANSAAVAIHVSNPCIAVSLLLLVGDRAYDRMFRRASRCRWPEEYTEVFGVTPRRAHRLLAGRF